ncbi:MAG TPA: hypothetical protein VJ417_11385, partial [Candidatus Glassbacteria bacterium]|nr:hypothetical protein [Candidatus Glassbacteria bacterium]
MLRRPFSLLAIATLLLLPSNSPAEIKPNAGRDLLRPDVLSSMQRYLLEKRFDGWLFTGQGNFSDIDSEFLGLRGQTRHRWFIFYPGLATLRKPFLIYHPDDEPVFDGLSFYPVTYRSLSQMKDAIKRELFTVAKDIGLNYSPQLQLPEISEVDAGTVELLQEIGFKVRSSGTLLSFYQTRWTVTDAETHKLAAARLDSLLSLAVGYLRDRLSHGKKVADYDLAGFIRKRLKKLDLEPAGPVSVALGSNIPKESWEPDRGNRQLIKKDTLVYLEVSAKKRKDGEAMHARLGWMLYTGESVPDSLANR